jgi:biotin carboxylase
VRFHDEAASVDAIVGAARDRPLSGVLALGDRPAVLAAAAAETLGLPCHPPEAARAAANKPAARARFRAAGLAVPWDVVLPADTDPLCVGRTLPYPCVVKPLSMSASRGVIRANDAEEFHEAFRRIKALLESRLVQALRDPASASLAVEGYIDGDEYAVEGLLDGGRLRVLAIFDKPDPLVGPYFEETIYVTPSRAPIEVQRAIEEAAGRAAAALGLIHGPVHVECRVNGQGIFVLEAAARPIGGLCARVLRFVPTGVEPVRASLEDLLVRHAAGEDVMGWPREERAAGVMMMPIPRAGVYRGVSGLEEATTVSGVDGVYVTAKLDQQLVPLPEGASYLGFIFARGVRPEQVESSLRESFSKLTFTIDRGIPMI